MSVFSYSPNNDDIEQKIDQYEDSLRRFGIECNSLPEDVKRMLDVCVETQMLTGLHDINELYLKEFYLLKKKEHVDNNLAAAKLQAEIDDLKKQIQMETTECDILKKFISQKVVSEEESRITASLLETKTQSLQSKKDQIQLPANLNFDELMKKVEMLKCRDAELKK